MSTYSTKNYFTDGGNELVIGGKLSVLPEATVLGLNSSGQQLEPATETKLGGVKAAPKQTTDTVPVRIDQDGMLYVPTYHVAECLSASTATSIATLKEDYNKLLIALKAAGIMALET